MILKLYGNQSLWHFSPQIRKDFPEEPLRLFGSNTPSPTWTLLSPARTMRIISDMAFKRLMKPIYQLFVSVRDTDLQPIGWVPLLCSTWANRYHQTPLADAPELEPWGGSKRSFFGARMGSLARLPPVMHTGTHPLVEGADSIWH